MDFYKTISKKADISIEIEKSTFIGIVVPILKEEDVGVFMADAKQEYPNATHYVYGYTFGRKQRIMRFSDDGEPSGTGGLPILEIIKHKELEDLLIVVVRYYGGVKLGTGGLKRAYSRAALDALDKAGIMTLTLCSLINITCPYTFWGKIQYEFDERNVLVEKLEYGEEVTISVAVPTGQVPVFEDWLKGITASQIAFQVNGNGYRRLYGD